MSATERFSPESLTESWPDAESPDPVGEAGRQFVVNLIAAMGDRSIRSVANGAGLDEKTIRLLLAGRAWPDLRTIALLEIEFGTKLYEGVIASPR